MQNEVKLPTDIDKIETIIGVQTVIQGDFNTSLSLRVDGTVNGDITALGDVYTGEQAKIFGDIHCRNLFHCGYIKGDVMAEGQIELAGTARLVGNSTMAKMITENGAEIIGSTRTITPADKPKQLSSGWNNSLPEQGKF